MTLTPESTPASPRPSLCSAACAHVGGACCSHSIQTTTTTSAKGNAPWGLQVARSTKRVCAWGCVRVLGCSLPLPPHRWQHGVGSSTSPLFKWSSILREASASLETAALHVVLGREAREHVRAEAAGRAAGPRRGVGASSQPPPQKRGPRCPGSQPPSGLREPEPIRAEPVF